MVATREVDPGHPAVRPVGSGKSTLAARLGLPMPRLDDFYREGGDPLLPRDAAGRVDWDAPARSRVLVLALRE